MEGIEPRIKSYNTIIDTIIIEIEEYGGIPELEAPPVKSLCSGHTAALTPCSPNPNQQRHDLMQRPHGFKMR